MIEMTPFLSGFLIAAMCLLAGVLLLCLVRAIRGPRFTDRVVALNVIGTVVILFICILSYFLGESYLVDIAILYALLNMLAVVILCRVARTHHRARRSREEEPRD